VLHVASLLLDESMRGRCPYLHVCSANWMLAKGLLHMNDEIGMELSQLPFPPSAFQSTKHQMQTSSTSCDPQNQIRTFAFHSDVGDFTSIEKMKIKRNRERD
jgi:hypothetical protein